MEVDLCSFATAEVVGRFALAEVFATNERIRTDIIKRSVDWQLARRMSGTKKVKNLSEVSGTGKKPHAQKGTGRARLGTKRPVQARGGAAPFALSTVHATSLQKKVRRLGLLHAIISKLRQGKLLIVNNWNFANAADMPTVATETTYQRLTNSLLNVLMLYDNKYSVIHSGVHDKKKTRDHSYLLVSGNDKDLKGEKLYLASRNLHNVTLLPQIGINVYDILKHDVLILDTSAIDAIQTRITKI